MDAAETTTGGVRLIGYTQRRAGDSAAEGPDGVVVHLVRGPAACSVIEVAARCAHPHLLPVLDIGTAPNGDVVAAVPPAPSVLRDVLAHRHPSPGESVTIVAPIAQAVAALHAAGVAFGGLTDRDIRFDDRGAPLLVADAPPVVETVHGRRAFEASVKADEDGLLAIADALFAGHPVNDALRTRPEPMQLAALVLGAAVPVPVDDPARARPEAPGRVIPIALPETPGAENGDPVAPRSVARAVGAAREVPPARLHQRVRRAAVALGTVRQRTWVLAGSVGVLLVIALVALPDGGAGASQESAGTDASRVDASRVPVAPSSAASRPATAVDPAKAVGVLLEQRAGCLERGTAACLAAVDASGSPIESQDRAAIAAGTVPARPTGSVHVVARTGAAVTAEVGSSVVLIVEGHDGWRLRDVVPSGG